MLPAFFVEHDEQMVKENSIGHFGRRYGDGQILREVRRGMQEMQQIGETIVANHSAGADVGTQLRVGQRGHAGTGYGAEQISEALLQLTESAQQTVNRFVNRLLPSMI